MDKHVDIQRIEREVDRVIKAISGIPDASAVYGSLMSLLTYDTAHIPGNEAMYANTHGLIKYESDVMKYGWDASLTFKGRWFMFITHRTTLAIMERRRDVR